MSKFKYKVVRTTKTNKRNSTNHNTLATAMKEAKKSINSFKGATITKVKPKVSNVCKPKRRVKRAKND